MQASYDPFLVTLSYLVSVFGAFTSFRLALRLKDAETTSAVGWLVGGAFAMGGGAIWAMHFIGMVAYNMDMTVRYDLRYTVASLLLAVLMTGLGLWIGGRGAASLPRLIASGVFMGFGIAGMHYLGMAAMRMPADLEYDPWLVALSLVIAVVAGTAAIWLAFNLQGGWQHLGSAPVMATAVCGMHYTGMAAATIKPNVREMPLDSAALSRDDLAFYVSLAAVTMLAILLFTALRDRFLSEPLYRKWGRSADLGEIDLRKKSASARTLTQGGPRKR